MLCPFCSGRKKLENLLNIDLIVMIFTFHYSRKKHAVRTYFNVCPPCQTWKYQVVRTRILCEFSSYSECFAYCLICIYCLLYISCKLYTHMYTYIHIFYSLLHRVSHLLGMYSTTELYFKSLCFWKNIWLCIPGWPWTYFFSPSCHIPTYPLCAPGCPLSENPPALDPQCWDVYCLWKYFLG